MTSDGTRHICTEDCHYDSCSGCGEYHCDDASCDDGTEDVSSCCTDRCDGSCGGYGFAFELAVRNVRDGIEGARPIGTWFDETRFASNGSAERRVTFIGQPSAAKTSLAGASGERVCDGTEEPFTEGELPGFVGMLHGGKADLARRAKAIVRGEDREAAVEEALRRLEEGPTMPSFSPSLICKCPAEACVCRSA